VTRIGVDVGGTFTDLILVDEEAGRITVDPVAANLFLSGEPLCSARDAA
jgi:N-methylhydantoinase A/oxoprolinase/acetone carboxylase beta subunit